MNNPKRLHLTLALIIIGTGISLAQRFTTYSYYQQLESMPEEKGLELNKVSDANDNIYLPTVYRNSKGCQWLSNRVLAISPDGKELAYLSSRNGTTNVFVKDLDTNADLGQRTKRNAVQDFSYSPDGKYLVFSELRGNYSQAFRTSSKSGFVCQQITNGSSDYSPIYSSDMSQIFFARGVGQEFNIWTKSTADNTFSSYTLGMNPCPLRNEPAYICTRFNPSGCGELWKINYETGEETAIVSDPENSFTSATISPNGEWVAFVGSSSFSVDDKPAYWHTDLFVCKTDGSDFNQLTYHIADDLSPAWSVDGKYIYFISQRGNTNDVASIYRLRFTKQ